MELTTTPSLRLSSLSSTTAWRPPTKPASPNPSPRRLRIPSPTACSSTAPTARMWNTRFPTPSASEQVEGERNFQHLRSSVESQHIVTDKVLKSLFLVKNLNEFIYIRNKLL